MSTSKEENTINYYTQMLVVGSNDKEDELSDSEYDYQISNEDYSETDRLKSRIMQLQEQLSNYEDLKAELQLYQDEMKQIKEKAYLAADEIRKAFTDKHQKEMKRKIELHAEEEKRWCETRLQLEEDLFKSEQVAKSIKEDNSELRDEIKGLQDQFAANEKNSQLDKDKLNEELTNVMNELEKYKDVSRYNHNLKQEIKSLQQIRTESDSRLKNLQFEMEEEKAKFVEEIANYREENFHLREENLHLKDDLKGLESDFKKSTADFNNLNRTKAQLEFEKLTLDNNLKQTQIQVQCLQQELAYMNSRQSRQSNYSNKNKLDPPPAYHQLALEAPFLIRPPSTPAGKEERSGNNFCAKCGADSVNRKERSNSNGNIQECKPITDGTNFREFVSIKRELGVVKSENSILREQLRACGFLPPLQKSQKR